MTGHLAFVGGPPFTSGCTFDRGLVEAAGADEVLLLPTAAAYERPSTIEEKAKEYFGVMGFSVVTAPVLSRADALDPVHADRVRTARCIYLVGSSAMHAKSVLIHTPVWDALVAAWMDGATVVGVDAGAQILGDPMVDSRGGGYTVGLGLLHEVAVIPQRNTLSVEALHRSRDLNGPDRLLFGIDQATAAIRKPDGTWYAEGAGTVDVHLGDRLVELVDVVR